MKGSWFEFLSGYSDSGGVTVKVLNNLGVAETLQLSKQDVTDLLVNIDGQATANGAPPFQIMLAGSQIQVNELQWHEFVDGLQSVAGEGGWHAFK